MTDDVKQIDNAPKPIEEKPITEKPAEKPAEKKQISAYKLKQSQLFDKMNQDVMPPKELLNDG